MEYFAALSELPTGFGPSAVTFGKFDGVHLGHRAIIDALREVAIERRLVPTVVTFDRNPLATLDPARRPESLTSGRQKRELLEAAGVGAELELPFDVEFSRLDAAHFVRDVLVTALGARVVLVGPEPRFGAGGRGHLALLVELGVEYGFEVRQLPATNDRQTRVSSTRVRELLGAGAVSEAATLLGRLPTLRAAIVRGQKRGRALGYPTANLSPELEGFIPADGVYAGWLTVVTESDTSTAVVGERMPAAISIGNNPTFEGVPARQVEAFVLDADLDLYDAVVEVEFAERVRGMERFDSLEALVTRMDADTAEVRAVLGAS